MAMITRHSTVTDFQSLFEQLQVQQLVRACEAYPNNNSIPCLCPPMFMFNESRREWDQLNKWKKHSQCPEHGPLQPICIVRRLTSTDVCVRYLRRDFRTSVVRLRTAVHRAGNGCSADPRHSSRFYHQIVIIIRCSMVWACCFNGHLDKVMSRQSLKRHWQIVF